MLVLDIRIIVLSQLPQEEQNAMLHLFTARPELIRYGQQHYLPHSRDTSSLFYKLLQAYDEDPNMSDKLKEFVRQTIDELLETLPPEELRKRLSPAQRLEGLPVEERLKGLPPEERVKGLSIDEVVGALSPEALEALKQKLKANGASPKPQ